MVPLKRIGPAQQMTVDSYQLQYWLWLIIFFSDTFKVVLSHNNSSEENQEVLFSHTRDYHDDREWHLDRIDIPARAQSYQVPRQTFLFYLTSPNQFWACVRGVHAPCSFWYFPLCSLLFSVFRLLTPLNNYSCSLFIFLCCLLLFFLLLDLFFFSMLLFSFSPCSMLLLIPLVLLAPGLSFVCSLLLYLLYSLLLAPLWLY